MSERFPGDLVIERAIRFVYAPIITLPTALAASDFIINIAIAMQREDPIRASVNFVGAVVTVAGVGFFASYTARGDRFAQELLALTHNKRLVE